MEDRNNMEVKKNNKIDISQIIKTVISKKVLFLKDPQTCQKTWEV